MTFAIITFFVAFFIEGIGTYVSISGLSKIFASSPVVVVLAVALDAGKLVCVSFLYTYWKKINFVMKTYMLLASMILMIITSAGAASYLSAEFQSAILGTKEGEILVTSMNVEKTKLEARKKEIDAQITNLPTSFVKGRQRLMDSFKDEITRLNTRITEIDAELPKLQVKQVNQEAHVGPILYVAKAFDVTVEEAVKWVILMIVLVFDPLAVTLIIAGNFLLSNRRKEKDEATRLATAKEDDERKHRHEVEIEEAHHRHLMALEDADEATVDETKTVIELALNEPVLTEPEVDVVLEAAKAPEVEPEVEPEVDEPTPAVETEDDLVALFHQPVESFEDEPAMDEEMVGLSTMFDDKEVDNYFINEHVAFNSDDPAGWRAPNRDIVGNYAKSSIPV